MDVTLTLFPNISIELKPILVCVLVAQSCPTLCDPMDCSPPPGSSVHGILQARILGWVAIPFSRGSSQPRDWTWVSCIAGRFFTIWATREAQSQSILLFNLALPQACEILVPQSRTEPTPWIVKSQHPNHWTAREFPQSTLLVSILAQHWLFCPSAGRDAPMFWGWDAQSTRGLILSFSEYSHISCSARFWGCTNE